MDIAKCVAVAATNDVPVRDMLGHGRVPRPGLPPIVVSTTHVAGADTGSAAVLQIDEQTHAHGVVDSPYLLADVVINDPGLTLTMTPEATVDTCLDTLVTGIECLTGQAGEPAVRPLQREHHPHLRPRTCRRWSPTARTARPGTTSRSRPAWAAGRT